MIDSVQEDVYRLFANTVHHIKDLNILWFWHLQQVLEPVPYWYQGTTLVPINYIPIT